MLARNKKTASILSLFLFVFSSTWLEGEQVSSGTQYAIATVHPVATDAAEAVFEEGGNAIDAAIAAALTLSVVDNQNSGIGGGCLILVRKASGELLAIDGREMAPAAAHRDMYLVDGVADPELSQTGPLAVGVPGALAAYVKLLDEGGTMPLSRLLAPGEKAARNGVPISWSYASRLRGVESKIKRFSGSREVLCHADGTTKTEGDLLVQTDLANTYAAIAQQGPKWFYEGEFATQVANWMTTNGGIITTDDFANYSAKQRKPIISTYRGKTIVGFPPPSSGGVHVAQVLNLLEKFDLGKILASDPAEGYHLIAEAMKLAFADRAFWLGDSDFVEVPRGLFSKAYASELVSKIKPDIASNVQGPSSPKLWNQDLFGRHTTHLTTADAQGNWVAITATVNTTFGSGIVVPGTGVVLNNEMDDFSAQPGKPNAFGLLGAENNAIEPGKRPLSSMSPTLVLNETGTPIMTVGAAGGPKIITQVILAIIHHLDEKMPIDLAIAAPRIHHQWRPDQIGIELRYVKNSALADQHEAILPIQVIEGLLARGHSLQRLPSSGVSQAISLTPDGKFTAVSDPRIPGKTCAK